MPKSLHSFYASFQTSLRSTSVWRIGSGWWTASGRTRGCASREVVQSRKSVSARGVIGGRSTSWRWDSGGVSHGNATRRAGRGAARLRVSLRISLRRASHHHRRRWRWRTLLEVHHATTERDATTEAGLKQGACVLILVSRGAAATARERMSRGASAVVDRWWTAGLSPAVIVLMEQLRGRG